MAISLDKDRVSLHEFTKEEVGTYVFNEVKCTSDSQVSYKFRITAWFDKLFEDERKVKVRFNSRLYSDQLSSFAQYSVNTKVLVDDVQKASKTISSLGTNSNVAGATWEGELEYAENGTLESVVKATLSCTQSGIHPPKSANVDIKVKFPIIAKLKNPSLKGKVGDNFVDCIAYVYPNNAWIEAVAYSYHDNEWKKGV